MKKETSILKYILITLGTVAGIVLIGFVIWAVKLAGSFSWRPPSTALELSQSEIDWKKQVQKKYDCTISFIGLDDSFMEDSVIYMNIDVEPESPLQRSLIHFESTEQVTQELAATFAKKSLGREDQKCIELRFRNLFFSDSEKRLKYPVSKKSMYHFKTKSVLVL